jgi:hypothetical protein
MKIARVDAEIVSLEGEPVVTEERNGGKKFTVKAALLAILGSCAPGNAEEAIRIREVGMLLAEAKGEFVFRESDEALIKKALDGNTVRYNAVVIGQVALAIKNATAEKGGK